MFKLVRYDQTDANGDFVVIGPLSWAEINKYLNDNIKFDREGEHGYFECTISENNHKPAALIYWCRP